MTRWAYVDSSCLVQIALRQAGHERQDAALRGFDRILTSTLTEAEVRAALFREGSRNDGSKVLVAVSWLKTIDRLTAHIGRILLAAKDEGVALKGADVWHLACALRATPRPELLSFLSLDARQTGVAARLGFQT